MEEETDVATNDIVNYLSEDGDDLSAAHGVLAAFALAVAMWAIVVSALVLVL